MNKEEFKEELANLLNHHGVNTYCGTAGTLLADYLVVCVEQVQSMNIALNTTYARQELMKELVKDDDNDDSGFGSVSDH